MDYKQKYEQLTKFIKDLYPHMSDYCKEKTEGVIPELKESEDERIRKEILNVFKQLDECTTICGRNYDYAKWIAWLEKQGVQKSADKVEPKFKVGDWIVTNKNHIWYVDETPDTTSYLYRLINQYGKVEVAEFEIVDKKARLWTIKDAKDGDVLSFNDGHGNDCIELIKSITDKKIEFWFCLTNGNQYEVFDGVVPYTNLASREDATPATKEQRDLLFQKIKEAGYEWDGEKKELKKIEQKPVEWSEEDEKERKRVVDLLEGWLYTFKETCYAEDCKCGIAWLKSLKPKSHWKPSVAQMNALQCFLEYGCAAPDREASFAEKHLEELYNDLIKLLKQ